MPDYEQILRDEIDTWEHVPQVHDALQNLLLKFQYFWGKEEHEREIKRGQSKVCKCGQKEIPFNVDRVSWYWQLHGRDKCTLELPNIKCQCGLLRSEHIEGHANEQCLSGCRPREL